MLQNTNVDWKMWQKKRKNETIKTEKKKTSKCVWIIQKEFHAARSPGQNIIIINCIIHTHITDLQNYLLYKTRILKV